MKSVKLIFVFLILSVFLISFVSSQGCDLAGWKGYGEVNENKTICLTCTTCNFINFSLINPTGNLILENNEMNKSGSTFCYDFDGSYLDELGTYQFDGYSQLEVPLGLCFDITLTGKALSIWAYIMSIVFVIILFIGLIWFNIKFDDKEREKLYNKIVIQYFKFDKNKRRNRGNLAYALFYLIAYGMLRMIFTFYYLLTVVFIFIFTEMVTAFGINTFSSLMPQILSISLIGLVFIGILSFAIFF